ncbi:pentapeptide repeat-containing protein [Dokdonella soli]|uniref:Pentapeptide repeat-containing protein n=1 Tax=Dokdonella soli TaxID=529810 RepID=A0ABN1IZY2_9GAMM
MKLNTILFALIGAAPTVISAQSIEVNGGDVSIQAGDTEISSKAGAAKVITGDTNHQPVRHPAQKPHRAPSGNTQTTVVDGTVINHAEGAGAVSEQTLGADTTVVRDETVVTHNGKTTVYTHPNVASGTNTYVNADLQDTDFSGKRLRGIAFTNANLAGANFSATDLRNADFTNADLSRARLQSANLAGADITNAQFDDAVLDDATWVDGRICAKGSRGNCR